MEAKVVRASKYFEPAERVRVSSVEDLKAIDEAYGKHSLILEFKEDGTLNITIYDDYVE